MAHPFHLRPKRGPGPSRPFLAGAADDPPAPIDDSGALPAGGRADGLHVLLVEDQTIIALDTESMLSELGAASIQSFMTAETALAWLASAQPDIGVLDIGLGTATSYPVADTLVARAIPFMFTTGYGAAHLIPARFSAVPVVHKPYGIEALADAFARCLATRRQA